MILDIISFTVLFGIIITLLVFLYIQRKQSINNLKMYIQSETDNELFAQTINALTEKIQARELEETDGFLKFVSDSRDQAFQYIESVQQSLEDFDTKMSAIIEYYSTYGSALGGLHQNLLKEVSVAYEELKRVLPNDETKV